MQQQNEWVASNLNQSMEMPQGAMYHRNGAGNVQPIAEGESLRLGAGDAEVFGLNPRPKLKPDPWRISTADRTRCLGIDELGVDIAAQQDAGWQVC